MILLLFPSVTHVASLSDFTSTVVVIYVVLGFPMETGLNKKIHTIGS
jgi:hypothetical protein